MAFEPFCTKTELLTETLTEEILTAAGWWLGEKPNGLNTLTKKTKTQFLAVWSISFLLHGTKCNVWQSSKFKLPEKSQLIP